MTVQAVRFQTKVALGVAITILVVLLNGCATPVGPQQDADDPPGLPAEEASLAASPPPVKVPDAIVAASEPRLTAKERPLPKAPAASTSTEDVGPATPAPVPEIVVNGTALSGYWYIVGPGWASVMIGLPVGAELRYSTDTHAKNICLLREQDGSISAQCSDGEAGTASGSHDGTNVTLRWWKGPVTIVFRGTVDGPGAMHGALSAGIVGLQLSDGFPVTMTRLSPDLSPPASPASQELVKAVLSDIDSGAMTPDRYEENATLSPSPSADTINPAPPPRQFTFLGTIFHRREMDKPEFREDVYRVSLVGADGAEFCRVGTNSAGLVRDFECRSLAF